MISELLTTNIRIFYQVYGYGWLELLGWVETEAPLLDDGMEKCSGSKYWPQSILMPIASYICDPVIQLYRPLTISLSRS